MLPFIVVIGLVLVIMWMYNTLIARKNDVIKSFSYIDVLLKKRYDLIPNLVETVTEYMNFEKGLLTDVTELRAKAMNSGITDTERVKYENQLTQKLGSIMVAAENYPDLKATQGFMNLQATWKDIEEQIAVSRQSYNASVTNYNNAVEMFPTNLVATMINFSTKPLLETVAPEKENIKAKDLFR
jgi:LemA protein